MVKKIICPHCGEAIEKRVSFCIHCGHDLPVFEKEEDYQIYDEIEVEEVIIEEPEEERDNFQPAEQQSRQRITFKQFIGPLSITALIGLGIGIISTLLSTLLLWVNDITFYFYNPSNLTFYLYRAFTIDVIFLLFTIVGIILSAHGKNKNIVFSIFGFVIGIIALILILIKTIAIGYYDIMELLLNAHPDYDYYTWEPWLIAAFVCLIIVFSISARYSKRILIKFQKMKEIKIIQAVLWTLFGLSIFSIAYLLYRVAMFFLKQF